MQGQGVIRMPGYTLRVTHLRLTPWTIDVRDIMHRPGEMRERELDLATPERFGNAVIGVPEGANVQIDLRLEALHDGVLVSAQVDATAVGECVRCLTDIAHPVEVDIQELFAYSEDEAFEYQVQDDHVDLEPVIRDAVVLSLPFQPVCQEDCPGLCPECGVRLLDNPGHEHEEPIDPRWAALVSLEGLTEATSTPTDVNDDARAGDVDREKR